MLIAVFYYYKTILVTITEKILQNYLNTNKVPYD